MQHAHWIHQARLHWREHLPQMYQRLKETGKLEESLQVAADQTAKAMAQLQAEGFDHHAAWEMTREQYLFLPEEPQPETEPLPTSQGYSMMLQMQRMRQQLGSPD